VDGVLRVDCPTEHFKESIRKIVLEFAGEPPEPPDSSGLVGSWRVGTRLELVFAPYQDAHRQLAESLSPRSLEVVDLNLEDGFIAYTRGRKRSLPLLTGDTNDVEDTCGKGAA
jgi:ABC-2 type transport system ATP-binding protein